LLPFNEQSSAPRVDCRRRDVIQSLHCGWGDIAKKMLFSHGARRAVVEDVDTIGWFRGSSSNCLSKRSDAPVSDDLLEITMLGTHRI